MLAFLGKSAFLRQGINLLHSSDDDDGLCRVIVETIRERRPQNVVQLIALVKEQLPVSDDEVIAAIMILKRQRRIELVAFFDAAVTFTGYLKSLFAVWYWIIIAVSLIAVTAFFTISPAVYPLSYIRNVFALIFVLWLPGYAFIKAVFPVNRPVGVSSSSLETIERFALSVGLSIALTPIVGLVFYYSPWGMNMSLIILALFLLTTVLLTVGIFREYKATSGAHLPSKFVDTDDRFSNFTVNSFVNGGLRKSRFNWLLLLAMFLLGALFCSFNFSVECSDRNFAVLPDDWGFGYYPDVPKYSFLDFDVTFNGDESIRLDPGGMRDPFGIMDRAIWTDKVPVSVGDHVYVSAWIKTSPSSRGDTIRGARIGIDYYVRDSIVDAVHSDYVHWGTDSWTYRDISALIPDKVYREDHVGNPISPGTITHVIYWIQAQNARDDGRAWYADTTLYVNPPAKNTPPIHMPLPIPRSSPTPQSITPTTPSPPPSITPSPVEPSAIPPPLSTSTPRVTVAPTPLAPQTQTSKPSPTLFTSISPSPTLIVNEPMLSEMHISLTIVLLIVIAAVIGILLKKRSHPITF